MERIGTVINERLHLTEKISDQSKISSDDVG